MATKIKPPRSLTTGRVPTATSIADFGEALINITDRKLFVRDLDGAARLIAQGIANHSTALIYALGDLTIFDDKLYLCSTAVPVPGPFVPASWTLLGGGGSGDLTSAVILAPTTLARNKINTLDNPAASGLIIEGDPAQTADLLVVEGSSQSDPGRWAIDALGFPNARAGSVVWRQVEPTHAFVARGQPAAFNGTRWVPADADETWGTALALVQEVLDANTLVLRADGRISNLQITAFAGGTITPGTTYYVSSAVPGQLTPVEPTEGRRDAVLTTISATTGVVTVGASRRLVEAPPPVIVGPTAPADPDLGDLWYRTTAPIGLRVWRDDISIGEWVAATDVPPQVISVGDAAPAAPLNGKLWFKTVEPVGLYVWYTDVDSSQWVAVGGSGQEVPAFATTAEARAGTVTDRLMSPALVQDRGGDQSLGLTGLTSVTFNGIPAQANEIDLIFSDVTIPTGSVTLSQDWSGDAAARAWSTRSLNRNNLALVVAGDDNAALFVLETPGATQITLNGLIRLVRGSGNLWGVSGGLRRTTTEMLLHSGLWNLSGASPRFPRINCTAAFVRGTMQARWRI